MSKPRPEKKRERKDNGQLPLPTSRAPAASSEIRVLTMQLQVGDRLTDQTGEYEVIGRPYTTNATPVRLMTTTSEPHRADRRRRGLSRAGRAEAAPPGGARK